MSLFKIVKTSQPLLSRCMSMLVNDPSYSWLADIGIKEVNEGVYNGSWGGNGNIVTSVSPINEQPIAQVIEVSRFFVIRSSQYSNRRFFVCNTPFRPIYYEFLHLNIIIKNATLLSKVDSIISSGNY